MQSKPIFAALLAAALIAPASAATYQFRVAAKGVIAPSKAELSAPSPEDAFTDVLVNATTAATFTLSNPGAQPLVVRSVAAGGDQAPAEFGQSNDCVGTIPGGGHCSITVNFRPSAVGARTGSLMVETTSKFQPTLAWALEGTAVSLPLGFGALTPGTAFDAVVVNKNASSVITLNNAGDQPLAIQAVNVRGSEVAAEFSQTSNCVGTLQAKSQCSITVSFAPGVVGVRHGTLDVTTNNRWQPTLGLALQGTAVPPPVAAITGGSWSDGTYAQSCLGYLTGDAAHKPGTTDGLYVIKPAATPYTVTCDMTGGGWTRFDYMVPGMITFPGDNTSVYTQRVQSQSMVMYKEIAAVSTLQKVLGVTGSSEYGYDTFGFYTQDKVLVAGTNPSYSGGLNRMDIQLTVNGNWQKAFGFTYLRSDGSNNHGGGANTPGESWFK